MSASEKLKALGPVALDALDELSGDAGWAHAFQPGGQDAPDREPDVKVILDALPQIVAVVEALERTACFDEQVGWDKCVDDPPRTICSRCAALAALEEVLT